MTVLQIKLLRTVRTTLGQFLALVVVAAGGIAVFYGTHTALANLVSSQAEFDRNARVADYYFDLVRAPEAVIGRLRRLQGIQEVAGRIHYDVKILRDGVARDTGRIVSFDSQDQTVVNRLSVTRGRYFENKYSTEIEVLIDNQYAVANRITPGARLEITAEGRKYALKVVGLATSPEFVHKIKSALEFPDWDGMAIIMMSHKQAQAIFGMPGEINQILVRLNKGVSEIVIKESVQQQLATFGVVKCYPRLDHESHKYIQNQIRTLSIASSILPPGLFLAAIMMQFVILRRIIKGQHLQIGIMKALGYENRRILMLYGSYAFAVAVLGTLLGVLCGTGVAGVTAAILGKVLELPPTGGVLNGKILGFSAFISVCAGLCAGLLASWEVVRIDPADAFRPQLPAIHGVTYIERWGKLWAKMNSPWKMSIRSISRNRARFTLITVGIALTTAMLLVTLNFTDSRDCLLQRHFVNENLYDYSVGFNRCVKMGTIGYWNGWPEIRKVEPMLEFPVAISRAGGAGVKSETKDDVIIGIEPSSTLQKVFDKEYRQLNVPEEGIILSWSVASKLSLAIGDHVLVETKPGSGPVRRIFLLVRGVAKQNAGGNSVVSLAQANRIIGENRVINSVMIKSMPGYFKRLENRFVEIPGIASVRSQQKQLQNAIRLLQASTYLSLVMMSFSLIIGGAIVYNSSLMMLNERNRELASLRVIGWSDKAVSAMLRNEITIALVSGIVVGLPVAKIVGSLYLHSISTEMFIWPQVLYPSTCAIAVAATIMFTVVGHLLAVRRFKNVDLIGVLRDRE